MSRSPLLIILSVAVCLAAAACNGDQITNIVNTGTDCGLLYEDVRGVWSVQYALTQATTASSCQCKPGVGGCLASTYDGMGVDVDGTVVATYAPIDVSGANGSASFLFSGDRSDGVDDAAVSLELLGSIQADSCLALMRIWEKDNHAFLVCLGTYDRPTHLLSGSCDSTEFDLNSDGTVEASCSLDNFIDFQAGN